MTFRDLVRETIRQRDKLTRWVEAAGGVPQAMDQLSQSLGVAPGETVEQVEDADCEAAASGVAPAAWTIEWVDPWSLVLGANVRVENAKADPSMVKDIRRRGVREPIRAYYNHDGALQVRTGLPQLMPMRPEVSGGVAVWAHVGGFVAGVILIKLFENRRLVAKRDEIREIEHPHHRYNLPRL